MHGARRDAPRLWRLRLPERELRPAAHAAPAQPEQGAVSTLSGPGLRSIQVGPECSDRETLQAHLRPYPRMFDLVGEAWRDLLERLATEVGLATGDHREALEAQ